MHINKLGDYTKQVIIQIIVDICKVNIGDFKGALENLNAFERKNSEDKNLWLQKALCLNELKQYPMAIEYYEKAKIAFPDSIKILKNLGLCHFQLSQYYGVIEVLEPYLDTIKNDQTCFEMIAFSPNSRFSISMFEGGVYKSFDNQNGKINPDVSFFLPIIGAKALDIDSTNNIIYGFFWPPIII